MKDFPQKQIQNIKKDGQYAFTILAKAQNDNSKAILCPNCNAELPEVALFCPECGSSTGHRCPKCGAPASATADICQDCGAWLLEGQCKFCYAEIPDEALFCPECGKPKEGIFCPHCGKLSIFDFCSGCGKPVTEEAAAELQRAQDEMLNRISPAAPAATAEAAGKTFSSNQEARRWFNASAIAEKARIEAEIAKLEVLLGEVQQIDSESEPEETNAPPVSPKPPQRKSLFSDKQLESIRKTGAAVEEVTRQRVEAERIAEEKRKEEERIAEEKRKAEEAERKRREEERKRKEEERQRQIKEAQALKEELERRIRSRNWLCNAYGTVHPGGPNECADPSRGGHYV